VIEVTKDSADLVQAYADSFRVYVSRAINTVDVTIRNGSV